MALEIYNLASQPLPQKPDAEWCDVFRAQVRHKDGTTRKVHLKVLGAKQLACELLIGDLGRKMGVPVPDCFLVRVKAPQFMFFEKSRCWQRLKKSIEVRGDRSVALFASATLEHPTLDHFLEEGAYAQNISAFVAEIADLETAAIFDEWIANPDRHLENILIADLKTWWLIDHGESFNRRQWEHTPMCYDERFDNCLADELLPNPLNVRTGQLWRARAKEMGPKARGSTPFDSLRDLSPLRFFSPADTDALGHFLEQRSKILLKLVDRRLKEKTQQKELFEDDHV